jgi:hypothetical protein
VNGKVDVGPGSLRFGTDFSTSLGNHSISTDGFSEDENSGSMLLTPFVGYEMAFGSNMLGGLRLKYDLIQTDRKFTNNSLPALASAYKTYEISGGNNLALYAFYEINFEPVLWGVDLGVYNHAGSKLYFDQAATSVDAKDSMTAPVFDTYAKWDFAPGMSLLPKIGLNYTNPNQVYLPNMVGPTPGGLSYYLTVAARFTL